jgi:heptosyltransferase-2
MSLPALRALRDAYPAARITVLAKPWVADLYARERFADEILQYPFGAGAGDVFAKLRFALQLRSRDFDCAILLQNAFEAAALSWAARIPARIGYNRDGRGLLLTHAIPVPPKTGHERFYYLELLKRSGIINELPAAEQIRLDAAPEARAEGSSKFEELGIRSPIVGVSPGAAYGTAKRWHADRFGEAAAKLATELRGHIAVFGARSETGACDAVLAAAGTGTSFAGRTTLREFIDLAAACTVFLTNDSGAMHIASALGVPTVAIFGATDDVATGPTGTNARVVREHVECSPCLLRECPIDHRCMDRVTVDRVVETALELLRPVSVLK